MTADWTVHYFRHLFETSRVAIEKIQNSKNRNIFTQNISLPFSEEWSL